MRTEKDITPTGGLPHYGVGKEDYLLIKGCCVRPKKRVVTLRQSLLKQTSRLAFEIIPPPDNRISTFSSNDSITPILDETFEPPTIAAKDLFGLDTSPTIEIVKFRKQGRGENVRVHAQINTKNNIKMSEYMPQF
ncbi:hypothetical protein IFM89_022512 [Coptis chinensis]|uniref:Uncharacterized protein n=1 Tax=Coptis chinensis TaxID=261450 RepID=A0A835M1A5_9MAGN|nr:hypothetical protein IFM89_022512 [Coptis chinensis]